MAALAKKFSGFENMFPNKIYELGMDLGISKEDIDTIAEKQTKKTYVKLSSPMDVYKIDGRYGTISINDFY